mmetsp:Transcript_7044/g.12621  ORF Transcript_7044/g.12621 Transcript_7044/m.12621 type:complete len:90 (-) Transcript_7044:492-761(-)
MKSHWMLNENRVVDGMRDDVRIGVSCCLIEIGCGMHMNCEMQMQFCCFRKVDSVLVECVELIECMRGALGMCSFGPELGFHEEYRIDFD